MKREVLFCLFTSLLGAVCQFGLCNNVYKAGVVEYYYDVESKLEPRLILERNINKYVNLVEEFHKHWPHVKNGILVFPECGLASLSKASLIAVAVPEPDILQNNFTGFKIINPLSMAANKTHTWLVINLVEKDGPDLYNTDVVFRSNGTIAAKYRKYNLFNEPVNKPSKAEVVSFTTDFNVTFGIFTCFDILYPHPALDLVRKGIKHIIFPTAWYSELPFLTAVQYQKGWSWANDVSLLAAGLSYSKLGSTGSGIFRGRQGHDIYYQTSNSNESHLLMGAFDIDNEDYFENSHLNLAADEFEEENESKKKPPALKLLHESLNAYTTVLIEPDGCKIPPDHVIPGAISNCTKKIVRNLTHHHLRCDFHLQYDFNVYICKEKNCHDAEVFQPKLTAEDDFTLSLHRLAAFDGVRSFYVATGGIQTCAVVPCSDQHLSSCGYSPKPKELHCFSYGNDRACVLHRYIKHVKIGGDFNQNNTLVSPNILLRSDHISGFGKITNNFHMSHHSSYYSLEYEVPHDDVLGTAAIWSRNFNIDGQPVTGKSSTLSLPLVISITLIFVYFLKYIL